MYRNTTTLKDVYKLALPTSTELLVGNDLLNRTISWACSLRPSQPAFPRLEGSELAFVDVDDLRQLDSSMRLDRVIVTLDQARASAVAVRGEVDEAAIAKARQVGIALLRLPDDEMVSQIERDVIRLIVDRDGYVAQRSSELQQALNQLTLDNGDLAAIAQKVYSFTQQPTLFIREDGQIEKAAFAEALSSQNLHKIQSALPNATALRSWAALQSSEQPATELSKLVGSIDLAAPIPAASIVSTSSRNETKGTSQEPSPQKRRTDISAAVAAPIVLSDSIFGYCLLLRLAADVNDDVSAVEEIGVSLGASAAALTVDKQNAVDVAQGKMRAAFVDELLATEIADEQAWIQRGSSLGYNLVQPHVAWVVQANNVADWPNPLLRFVEEQEEHIPFTQREEGMLLFWPIENPKSGRALKVTADEFVNHVQERIPQAELTIGIARPATRPSEWQRSQQQATESWRLGRSWKGAAVTYFGDLEFYQLLTLLRNNMESDRFFRRTLGRLLAHDESHNAELVQTLEGFFSCHGNASRTADRLHIHRNTLTYRLERIAEITQLDLDDPDARFSLQLALKLRPVIG